MIGIILIDLPSTIEGDYFFRSGEIVQVGYHRANGELCDAEDEYLWAENFGWNPKSSLDFLNADEVAIVLEIITQKEAHVFLEQELSKKGRGQEAEGNSDSCPLPSSPIA
ncbi:hypothetical protein VF04_04240 [Nostoc linckia z7]|uniref:Uncharacterized protein n=3 Tax=Nostoc linckia TaxID=92942 RepID=A0A9Q5ZGG4_NOSLI|nr:hypothetical protein [Nostoc linckia]PHJ65000.1 hypothetical protein VF02_11725 [Nostoc linckia z1]PHJ70178.1 hypothetical protein VF05_11885 [Nostoc linckia z3]PHJ82967.1 hypothetical protein VF06_14545 [Nostoc linckia z4]PHJ89064.1 hypothetical protein VF07_13740 [Nostoc linckia z6]PHK00123.1 hypothetical protein VF04_04240 [Nostoc linckia z7]PHK06786.1 hypothetical protein VF08_03370 [Nostoc linckia z8]PHK26947.1 hypothetical protein VF10_00470 [Nostoc linckia z13]PHK42923.1 hypotheti